MKNNLKSNRKTVELVRMEVVVSELVRWSNLSTQTSLELTSTASAIDDVDKEALLVLKDVHLYQNKLSEEVASKVADLLRRKGVSVEVSRLQQLLPHCKTSESLLSIGGDDRLTLNISKNKENKYLSSTFSRGDVLRRGSCTCSTTEPSGYAYVEQRRVAFLAKAADMKLEDVQGFYDQVNQTLIQRLKRVCGMDSVSLEAKENKFVQTPQAVLFPSGSDAEYLPLVIAWIRSFKLTQQQGAGQVKVYNFVTAAGEVGSGTPNACTGQHFSPLAPRGNSQKSGSFLADVDADTVKLIQYKPRAANGDVAFQEEQIAANVRSLLSADACSVAVLHLVCGSKTGLIYPSLPTVTSLRDEFKDRLVVVIDACQLRCRLDKLQTYLQQDFLILVTGSKFYTGPPFCGAVLLPANAANILEEHLAVSNNSKALVPSGLTDYITSFEVEEGLKHFRSFLQESVGDKNWFNLGLHLRWDVSLSIMERYAVLNTKLVTEFTKLWVSHVKRLVQRHGPLLTLLEHKEGVHEKNNMCGENVGDVNTIVSIALQVVEQSEGEIVKLRSLNVDEYKEFHRLMTLSLPKINAADQDVEAKVMLGQPVKLADSVYSSILRIALGADMVIKALEASGSLESVSEDYLLVQLQQAFSSDYAMYSADNVFYAPIQSIMREDAVVVRKMMQLCQHWTALSTATSPSLMKSSRELRMQSMDNDLLLSVQALSTSAKPVLTLPRLQAALKQVQVTNAKTDDVLIFYDLDAVSSSFAQVKNSFASLENNGKGKFLHCFAMKSCPLSYILHEAVTSGLGVECASIVEVQQALLSGCPAEHVVFDSPCKSSEELRFALKSHVRINANTFQELERIDLLLKEFYALGRTSKSWIGLRVNPLVGAGNIAQLSTATKSSKFGVAMYSSNVEDAFKSFDASSGKSNDDHLQLIFDAYAKYDFLSGVMCHVGSQGMPLDLMVQGVHRIATLANMIDEVYGGNRIEWLDFGGGLSANYDSDEASPSFEDYAQAIACQCPHIYGKDSNKGRVFITEFGKSLITKCAAIVSRVEDIITHVEDNKSHAEVITCITHAGADLALRTAYCPDKFPHRLSLLSATGDDLDATSSRPTALVNVVGPLCFSGDVLGKKIFMATPQPGDKIVVWDAGANTLSLFSRHCSRVSPAVVGFRSLNYKCQEGSGEQKSAIVTTIIRAKESEDDVIRFWG